MIISLLIAFRETLEASLIVGIMLAYLRKTDNGQHQKFVWMGVGAGIAISVALAYIFEYFFGGFTGRAEQMYESVTMLIATALLSWMIVWMIRQSASLKRTLEKKVDVHLQQDHHIGLMTLAFMSIIREGIETVIFLKAAFLQAQSPFNSLAVVAGVALGITITCLIFTGIRRLPIKSFFQLSGVALIIFGAGLAMHAVHECIEAGLLPHAGELWNFSSHPLLAENGSIGSILKGFFGYSDDTTLLEATVYISYIIVIAALWKKMSQATQPIG